VHVAVVELGGQRGQPVQVHRLGGGDFDAAVSGHGHRIQGRDVRAGVGQPRQPIVLVAERVMHFFDGGLVFGR
jgi:hypothetical protein